MPSRHTESPASPEPQGLAEPQESAESPVPQPRTAGVSRRTFVGAAGLGAAALGTVPAAPAASAAPAPAPDAPRTPGTPRAATRTAYLGTYTRGIITCTYDTATGRLTETGGYSAVSAPDFLAPAPSGQVLYSLDDGGPEGGVRAFAIGSGGALTPLGPVRSTGGTGVTHLSVHPGGRHLLSANYTSGSVAVHPIAADGSVGERTGLVQHTGSGPDPDRQRGPHAHQILTGPDGAFVFAVDLGTDSVYTYALDPGAGTLRPVSEMASRPGAGPRHMVFHPSAPYAYVANELDSTLTVCALDPATGALTRGQILPTLPDGTDPGTRNYPAEVTVSADGRFVYLSNRGHDSVVWFAVGDGGASLSLVDTVPCGGSWPRHISLAPSGTLLFSANERGSTIGVFTVDPDTGAPAPSGAPFTASSPGCVLPV